LIPARLEAQWKKLIMANYPVDPKQLLPYIPHGTEVEYYSGKCYLSLVGFMFLNSSLAGIKMPFHGSFEEINLRFYVRHYEEKSWKRGVVFIKEIVPRWTVTMIANHLYGESYETLPTGNAFNLEADMQRIEYRWKKNNKWNSLKIKSGLDEKEFQAGSAEEFFTESYWGYTKINNQATQEYNVEHPAWKIFDTRDYIIDVDFTSVYGPEFSFLQDIQPESVFLAEGSGIVLRKGKIIK
jgi:uncharacterized protein